MRAPSPLLIVQYEQISDLLGFCAVFFFYALKMRLRIFLGTIHKQCHLVFPFKLSSPIAHFYFGSYKETKTRAHCLLAVASVVWWCGGHVVTFPGAIYNFTFCCSTKTADATN